MEVNEANVHPGTPQQNEVSWQQQKQQQKQWRQILKNSAGPLSSIWLTIVKAMGRNDHPDLGPYIHLLSAMYKMSALCLMSPVYIRFCPREKAYVVQSCPFLQRICCIFASILMQASLYKRIQLAGRYVMLSQGTGRITPYFDFLFEISINFSIYVHIYIHFCQVEKIRSFVKILQTTSLLRFARLGVAKARLVAIYCSLAYSLLPTLSYLRFVYGIDFSSLTSMVLSGHGSARQIFWLESFETNSLVDTREPNIVTSFLAIGSQFFNVLYHHHALAPHCFVPIFCVYYVAQDFFRCLSPETATAGAAATSEQDGGVVSVGEVLDYFEDYKEILGVANRFVNNYTFLYILLILSWHSVHLFDILNVTDPWWRLTVFVYLVCIWTLFYFPAKTLLYSKQLKKWLARNEISSQIPKQGLKLLLFEQLYWAQGMQGIRCGKFLVMSPALAGSVFQQVCSSSMLVKLTP